MSQGKLFLMRSGLGILREADSVFVADMDYLKKNKLIPIAMR